MNPELLNTRLDSAKNNAGNGGARFGESTTDRKGRTKKRGRRVVQSRELYDKFNRSRKGKQGKARRPAQRTIITQAAEHKRVVRMEEAILVSDLAHQMGVKSGEVAMKLMFDLGLKGATLNTTIDQDTAELIAEQYGYKVEKVGFDLSQFLPQFEETEEDFVFRPPVVTVMGHVDHGKTSLLDMIRTSSVTDSEHGGITQHIGAYLVQASEEGEICFLDTPGHEAFSALRARGANATDIIILIVAADDGVMPQTVEAIKHAQEADVPIIVAVNKIDKPAANPDRVRQALTEYNLIPEEWGGTTIFVDISAKTGENIDDLLEMVYLQAELLDLKANPNRPAEGIIIESKLDLGRGSVATVLVQEGILKKGDTIVMGSQYGRVRTMTNEHNKRLKQAKPSTPVEVTGLSGVPASGGRFYVVKDEKNARAIADHIGKQEKQAQLALSVPQQSGMDRITAMMQAGDVKELKVLVKGDVQGSVDAVSFALQKLSTEKVKVRIILSSVGSITESDVNLAASSEEDSAVIIVGFNVRQESRAQSLAAQHGVVIETFTVIYDIIDRITAMMEGLLEPIYEEQDVGRAEVRAIFIAPRVGTIAGCMITDGMLVRSGRARLLRNRKIVYDGPIGSLRHFKKDVKELKAGFECGVSFERFNDIQVDDQIECYVMKAVKATL